MLRNNSLRYGQPEPGSLRIELQFTGENVNVWGERLNTGLQRVEYAIAGLRSIALTGDYALTTSNTADDDARYAILKFTGGAGPYTVTIPSVSKIYKVWNASSATITFATGAGSTVQVAPTDIVEVFCDGANGRGQMRTTVREPATGRIPHQATLEPEASAAHL